MSRARKRTPATPGKQASHSQGSQRGHDPRARANARALPRPEPAPALSLTHPAMFAVVLVAAACAIAAVTIQIYDTDFWQHLLGGKVMWQYHQIPTRQIWAWSTYGTPDVNASLLFRALIWPFWSWGGLTGLYVWRWLSTLAAFGLVWAAARRMGARGLMPLLVLVVCVLNYRQRSQIRPETLAAVLIALQIWILETRRSGGPDRTWALVPIAWVWANAHISYYLGFLVLGLHVIDSALPGARRPLAAEPRVGPFPKLVAVTLAAAAASFVNPFGWRALWLPFEFVFFLRGDPIYKTIGELQPILWSNNARNGLAVLIGLWPALLLWRGASGRGWDRVGIGLCAFFTPAMLNTQRLTGVYALVGAAYIARDLDAFVAARRWPAWTRPAWVRAALVAVTCVAVSIPDLSRIEMPLGIRLDMTRYPVKACDFIVAHGIRGRGYNDSYLGGYIAWRFWPDKERLPFATGTPEALTAEDRTLVPFSTASQAYWERLDAKYHFDYALLNRRIETGATRVLDFLDADTARWSLVFADDAAALYLRRQGPLASIAERYRYKWLTGGTAAQPARFEMALNYAIRSHLERELARAMRESPYDARAHDIAARIAYNEGRLDDARRHLELALKASPLTPRLHERIGLIDLEQGRAREALAQFRAERPLRITGVGLHYRYGQAYQAMGDRAEAARQYRKELKLDPDNAAARESLTVLGAW